MATGEFNNERMVERHTFGPSAIHASSHLVHEHALSNGDGGFSKDTPYWPIHAAGYLFANTFIRPLDGWLNHWDHGRADLPIVLFQLYGRGGCGEMGSTMIWFSPSPCGSWSALRPVFVALLEYCFQALDGDELDGDEIVVYHIPTGPERRRL
jgi:hypothetical protein